MSGMTGRQQDVDIDLAGLVGAIWRRRMRVLMAGVVCAGLGFGIANVITPEYLGEARVLIEPRQPEFSGQTATQPGAGETAFDDSGILSQVQVLRSVDLIKQVARNMKLYEIEEFDPTANPSAISDLMVMFGLKANPLEMAPEERVLKEFQERLQVYQVEKSRVIGIQFTSRDPALSAAIPNEMAKVYLSLQSGAKLDSNSEASRWLEPEIANLREKVREAEAKVADYRSNSDLLQTGETDTFATQQLNDISLELARVRGERANAEARAAGVRTAVSSGRAADTLTDVVGSQMIQRLKERESGIQAEIADLSTTLLDGHPRLKALKSQLSGLRRQIETETQKILGSLENEASVSRLREQQLVQQLNKLKAVSAKAGEDEVGLRALEREAAAQRDLLETYLARYREATSRTGENATPADARIISGAVKPNEVNFPKVLPITVVAGLAGLLVSAIAIMLAELFSGRALKPLYRDDEIEEAYESHRPAVQARPLVEPVPDRQPVAAAVVGPEPVRPAAKAAPAFVPAAPVAAPDEAEEDDFSIDAVAEHLLSENIRLAVCVSPGGDQGSAATVELGRRLSAEGLRTVLIDLTGSACPTRLTARSDNLPGITDLLSGDVAFAESIHDDRRSDMHIIPQGNAEPGRAMRGIDRLQMIVDALCNVYDLVLVECGPAETASLKRIIRKEDCEIILSAPDLPTDRIIAVISGFAAAGYRDIVLMKGEAEPEPLPGLRIGRTSSAA